eukprot:13125358-Alexandrium_andersonii.AAC.1
MEERFMRKVEGEFGGGPEDLREVKLLSRVVRWTTDGSRCEADSVARGSSRGTCWRRLMARS